VELEHTVCEAVLGHQRSPISDWEESSTDARLRYLEEKRSGRYDDAL